MKYLLKKYWPIIILLMLINIPVLIITCYRTNDYLTLKGSITKFSSVVEVDTNNEELGSFSTVYVINMNNSTIFQNYVADHITTVERGTISKSSSHLSGIETYNLGKIQYYSSIETSIILAYTEAKKRIDTINVNYDFKSYQVTYYGANSQFRIGDEIISVNGCACDRIELANALNNLKLDDVITIKRGNVTKDISVTKDDSISLYPRFNIDYDNAQPKIKFNDNLIGGPSGGLLQTLSIYNRLVPEDITHGLKIAGTGTISFNGNVGAIGGIKEKVPTALDNKVDIFLCVEANYEDALEAYNTLFNKDRMKLVKIKTFYDALNYLEALDD